LSSGRKLVVNADDFGFTRDVNEGIVEAHRNGIVGATTLMANGAAFEHAVELAAANRELDIGCHLTLVGGQSVLDPSHALPSSIPALVSALARGELRVYEELSAQVRKIRAAGIEPLHLDAHKHTHLLPPVLRAVARISREFGIRWVRRPFDFPFDAQASLATATAARVMALMRGRFRRVLEANGCRSTDHFAGFRITGRFGAAEVAALIRSLPPGTTELMCHPGYCGAELRAARTRLKESRERELLALTAPETAQAARDAGVEIVRYRDLG
jgi:chitin disaccharide deacetylase